MLDVSEIKVHKASDGALPINPLAGIVPMACPADQAAITFSISKIGQTNPIVLWKGEVVDGRCRQLALRELGKDMLYVTLGDDCTYDQVKNYVLSVNQRRNLSVPQKIAVACKEYMKDKNAATIVETAKSWGVGEMTLKNAIWLYRRDKSIIETIFDGGSVPIEDKLGNPTLSNKITTIYAYYKRKEENAVENVDHGWKADSFIKTQAGKDWYYRQLELISNPEPHTRYLIAELANFKFAASN